MVPRRCGTCACLTLILPDMLSYRGLPITPLPPLLPRPYMRSLRTRFDIHRPPARRPPALLRHDIVPSPTPSARSTPSGGLMADARTLTKRAGVLPRWFTATRTSHDAPCSGTSPMLRRRAHTCSHQVTTTTTQSLAPRALANRAGICPGRYSIFQRLLHLRGQRRRRALSSSRTRVRYGICEHIRSYRPFQERIRVRSSGKLKQHEC